MRRTQGETDRAHALSEQLGATLSLRNAFDPILNVIILALDAPAVFVRTKALRALSHILTVDSSVLSNVGLFHHIGTIDDLKNVLSPTFATPSSHIF